MGVAATTATTTTITRKTLNATTTLNNTNFKYPLLLDAPQNAATISKLLNFILTPFFRFHRLFSPCSGCCFKRTCAVLLNNSNSNNNKIRFLFFFSFGFVWCWYCYSVLQMYFAIHKSFFRHRQSVRFVFCLMFFFCCSWLCLFYVFKMVVMILFNVLFCFLQQAETSTAQISQKQ